MIYELINKIERFFTQLEPMPEPTERMVSLGLIWTHFDGGWIPVCKFCKGNCGQCGIGDVVGNVPFDFQSIIDNSALERRVDNDHI